MASSTSSIACTHREIRHAVACIEDVSDFRGRLKRNDVEVIALRRSRVGIWRVRRQLYALCRRLRPAIVHTRNMSGLDALLPARLAGVARCVHGEHGWDVDDLQGEKLQSGAAAAPPLAAGRSLRDGIEGPRAVPRSTCRHYPGAHLAYLQWRRHRPLPSRARKADRADARIAALPGASRHRHRGPYRTGEGSGDAGPRVRRSGSAQSGSARQSASGDHRRRSAAAALRELAGALGVADVAWFPGAMAMFPNCCGSSTCSCCRR